MLSLTRSTQEKILQILEPLFVADSSRETLIYDSLGVTSRAQKLIANLDKNATAHDFSDNLISQLINYGTIIDDEHGEIEALWAIMLAARDRVGVDKQHIIDELAEELKFIDQSTVAIENPSLNATGHTGYVFISYARVNMSVIERLIADLEAAKVPLWVDKIGLKPGTPDWEQEIRIAIRDAYCIFLAASPASQRSLYVRDELAIADMYNKTVYPLWVEGEHWINCIPMGRGYTQFIDLRGNAYRDNFTDVLGIIEQPVEKDHEFSKATSARDLTKLNSSSSNESLQRKLFLRKKNEFVGRVGEIELFQKNMTDIDIPIIFYHGIAGIGKTWLINSLISDYMPDLSMQKAFVDFADNKQYNELSTILTIRSQLNQQTFSSLMDTMARYESVLRAEKTRMPSNWQPDKPTNQVEQSIKDYLGKPHARRDMIWSDAIRDIREAFKSDILNLGSSQGIALFFDTVELVRSTSEYGDWFLNDLLLSVAGSSSRVKVILAGRKDDAWKHLNSQLAPFVNERELGNFRPKEVDVYIKKLLGVVDETLSKRVFALTQGHPLCLGLAIDWLNQNAEGVQNEAKYLKKHQYTLNERVVSGFLFERILDRIPSHLQRIIQVCAITHWFNADTILALQEGVDVERVGEYIIQIRDYSFVRPQQGAYGYTFHDIVRDYLIVKWRFENVSFFKLLNRRAHDYFEKQIEQKGEMDDLRVEKLYHLLAYDEEAGKKALRTLFDEFSTHGKKDLQKRLLDVAREHQVDNAMVDQFKVSQEMLDE